MKNKEINNDCKNGLSRFIVKLKVINKEQINQLTEKLYQAISNTINQLKNEGLWAQNK